MGIGRPNVTMSIHHVLLQLLFTLERVWDQLFFLLSEDTLKKKIITTHRQTLE